MHKIALTLLVLLVSVCSNAKAQYSISVEDVASTPGAVFTQTISASLPSSAPEFVEIVFEYAPTVVRVLEAQVLQDGLMLGTVEYVDSIVSAEEAYIRLWCETTQAGTGALVAIQYEGLRGPDTSTVLQPVELLVAGEMVTDVTFGGGGISVAQEPLTTVLRETLGFNYPNPFNLWTKFYLSIAEDDTQVEFTLYNLAGQIVYAATESFDAGDHEWFFEPESLELDLAQGAYYLQMETPRGSFHTSCMYLR